LFSFIEIPIDLKKVRMLSYISSQALTKGLTYEWDKTNLSNMLVKDIFKQYSKVYLSVNDGLSQFVIELIEFGNAVNVSTGTLQTLLQTWNISIPSNKKLTSLPSSVGVVTFHDAFRAGYTVNAVKLNTPSVSENGKTDLKLSRIKIPTDISIIKSGCLVTVNGYLHQTQIDNSGDLIVLEGHKTFKHSKMNHLGLLSFLNLGEIKTQNIDASSIIPANNQPLYDKLYFSIPESFQDKAWFLVLGGYMVFPQSGILERTGDRVFSLCLKDIPYLTRILESDVYLDLSSLGLVRDSLNNYETAQMTNGEVIRKYLTLSQSFIVSLPVNFLETSTIQLRSFKTPGRFITYQNPELPLFVNYGKLSEYWKIREDNQWEVLISDGYFKNYLITNENVGDLPKVNRSLDTNHPFRSTSGHFLKMTGYNL
jgi:hypothetical protein